MKLHVSIASLAVAAAFAAPACAQTVVPAQSEIAFTSKQMGVPVDGKFRKFDAQVAFDPKRPEAAKIGFTIDLVRLHDLDDPDAQILSRFATSIQLERQDFNGRMLTIRRSDLRVLASVMGRKIDELGSRLEQLGLRAGS